MPEPPNEDIKLDPYSGTEAPKSSNTKLIALLAVSFVLLFCILLPVAIWVTATFGKSTQARSTERKLDSAQVDLDYIASQIEVFYKDNKQYPEDLEDISPYGGSLRFAPYYPYSQHIDPFTPFEDPFEYYSDLDRYWIVRSIGPDRLPEVDLEEMVDAAAENGGWGDLLNEWTYDPTNGVESSGDIFRTGP